MTETLEGLPEWPFSLGAPGFSGQIRSVAEDFEVAEIPLVSPSGAGKHLWLDVEKRGANTHWVAEQLAKAAGAAPRDVGYAGLKDRHAVTRQWFSVGLQEAANDDWTRWEIPDVRIIDAVRHDRKLKRGALKGNRFRIRVRNLEGDASDLADRLERVRTDGVPNYFGPQRFGIDGNNLSRARHWLSHGGRLSRNRRSLYLSAVRSFLFNEVLAARVAANSWNRLVDGDIAMLDGSHSVFPCELPDPELVDRCARFDLHPTGPLPGTGGMTAEREAGRIESDALQPHAEMVAALERLGMRSDRRPLRLAPTDFGFERSEGELLLSFALPAGSFATSVLRELVNTPTRAI